MVRHAFFDPVRHADPPIRIFGDMDGLQEGPDNIPNRNLIMEHLGKPLTAIPVHFERETRPPQQCPTAGVPG